VVRLFEAAYEVPAGVEVLDAGTPGLDLTAYLSGLDAVVLVDAVKASAAPGALLLYSKEELLRKAPIVATSPHEPGVREALLHAEFQGVAPPAARLVGVVPGRVETGIGLSEPVRAALPRAVEQVAAELAALGAPPRRRDPPARPDLWWEATGR
jgi:hydrogenase maturation protease